MIEIEVLLNTGEDTPPKFAGFWNIQALPRTGDRLEFESFNLNGPRYCLNGIVDRITLFPFTNHEAARRPIVVIRPEGMQ